MAENQKDLKIQGNQAGQQKKTGTEQNKATRNQQEVASDEETITAEEETDEIGVEKTGRETKTPVAGQENNKWGSKNSGGNQNSGQKTNQDSNFENTQDEKKSK
jgi:hypothetical protein